MTTPVDSRIRFTLPPRSRPLIFCALVSSACLLMLPAVLAAGEPSWKSVFAAGETALAERRLDKAEELLRKALSMMSSQSHSPADQEKCMLKLADVLALRNKTDEAQALYEKLEGMLAKRYGSDSAQVVPVLFALGSIQESEGDHTAAMALYQRALNINEKHYGPYSPAVAKNLHLLGRATYKAGNLVDADKHYKRALGILSKDPSLSASKQLESLMHDYGDLIKHLDDSNRELIQDFRKDILKEGIDAGQPSDGNHQGSAEPPSEPPPQKRPEPTSQQPAPAPSRLGESAWQQQNRFQLNASRQWQTDEGQQVAARGPSRPLSDSTVAPAYKVIEDSIFKQNRYLAAENNYKRIIAADIDALGPNHPAVANDLIGLAQLYIAERRYFDAQPLLTRALAIYEQAYGAKNVLTITTRATLASAEFRLGHIEQAADLFRSALSDGQSVLGPSNLETANILNELAYLFFHQGKLQDACTFYGWALASTEGAVGQQDPLVAACLKDYAQVLRSLGRTSEAGAAEARAEKILVDAR